MALSENQPLQPKSGLVVEWRPDHHIKLDEYDRDFDPVPEPTDDALDPIDAVELADLVGATDAGLPTAPLPLFPAADQGAPNQHTGPDEHAAYEQEGESDPEGEGDPEGEQIEQAMQNDEYEDLGDANNDLGNFPAAEADDDAQSLDQDEGAATFPDHDEGSGEIEGAPEPRYNLRSRTDPSSESFRSAVDKPYNSKSYFPPQQLLYKDIFGYVMAQMDSDPEFGVTMTQLSTKVGLKKHGRKAEDASMAEFSQLEDLEVYEPLNQSKLTRAQKKAALHAINFVKEKRCGRLKGRTVANGRPQRGLYDKNETASPTVATDALVVSSIIVDAFERRDVATAGIAGAYLKANMKDFTIMKFAGASVDILCGMKPEYERYVVIENGVKVLYVRLIKRIYGCVQSALMW